MSGRTVVLGLFVLLVACARGQGVDPLRCIRISYEFSSVGLQRAAQARRIADPAQLVATSIAVIERRVGGLGVVARVGEAGFSITLPNGSDEQIARVRARVEAKGVLTLGLVPSDSAASIEWLASEKEMLVDWLEKGGQSKLKENPASVSECLPGRKGLRWGVHSVRAEIVDPTRWSMSFTQDAALKHATLPLFSPTEWNGGELPTEGANDPSSRLWELLAVSSGPVEDQAPLFKAGGFALLEGSSGSLGMSYVILEAAVDSVKRWSTRHEGRSCAYVYDGQVLAAAMMMAPLGAVGIVPLDMEESSVRVMVDILNAGALPVLPDCLSCEVRGPDGLWSAVQK